MLIKSSPLPNTQELGSVFGGLVNTYQSINGPTAERKTLPSYVNDVMGDGIVPSFRIHLPDDKFVGKNGKPYHVGRVVDSMHVALKSLMINFKFGEDFPPMEVQAALTDDSIVELERKYNLVLAPHVGKGKSFDLDPVNGATQRVLPLLMTEVFKKVKNIKITLEKRSNPSDPITITLPNEEILLNVSEKGDEGSRPENTPVPLAAVLWALNEGKTAVLGSQHTALVKYFIGLQTAFTEHMQLVQGLIQKQLDIQAPGKQVKDYLYLKEDVLKGIIRDEGHHLGIAKMAAFAIGKDPSSFNNVLELAYDKPPVIDLKDDKWAARDTAVAIYSASHHLRFSLEKLEPGRNRNAFLNSGLRVVLSKGDMLGNMFHSEYPQDDSEALKIAEDIAAIKPEDGKSLWRKVEARIRAHPEWIKTLQDIWLRNKIVDQVLTQDSVINPATDLLADTVPQIKRTAQLSAVERVANSARASRGSAGQNM